jgi:hypothetical protein
MIEGLKGQHPIQDVLNLAVSTKCDVCPVLSGTFTCCLVGPEYLGMTVDGRNVENETKSLRMIIHGRENDREKRG